MEAGKMKNMVVLRNLPSNLIDEAIIILKPNKTIKSIDYAKNNEKIKDKQEELKNNPKDYIINEAQMVISSYLSKIEEQKSVKNTNIKQIESRYKILKLCTLLLTGLFIINAVLNCLKL